MLSRTDLLKTAPDEIVLSILLEESLYILERTFAMYSEISGALVDLPEHEPSEKVFVLIRALIRVKRVFHRLYRAQTFLYRIIDLRSRNRRRIDAIDVGVSVDQLNDGVADKALRIE